MRWPGTSTRNVARRWWTSCATSSSIGTITGRCWAGSWELRHNVGAYDALYVALAEALDAPLLTADGRLAAAHGHRADVQDHLTRRERRLRRAG